MTDTTTEAAASLGDDVPVLLGPVRLEYRFTPTELLVRVFPDDWAVDSFEEQLSPREQEHALRYWQRYWEAGGEAAERLAAWRDLASHVGNGRAAHVVGMRRPRNPGAEPTRTRPDQVILVVAGDGPLPAGDRAPATTYWEAVYRAGSDAAKLRAADAALNSAVGATRARRIRARRPASLEREPRAGDRSTVVVTIAFLDLPEPAASDTRLSTWTQPARARLLPDSFTLLGYAGGQLVLDFTGNSVPADLPVGPDPATPDADQFASTGAGLHVPGPLSWLVDFDAAVSVGMGFRVPLTDEIRGGLDRLVVLGLRVRDPATSKTDLETLITHQANSRAGLRLLAQGTPTNNTGRTPSALGTGDEEAERFAALTSPEAPVPPEDWAGKTDGQWLAELLGVDPAVLSSVPGAGGFDQREARAMNAALWPATWGYHLATMLNPIFGTAALDATRAFFTRYVSGRGPVPALRVGRQPYGVLVTTAFSELAWEDADADAAHRRGLDALLSTVAQDWATLAEDVPFLGADGDPHALLLGILGLHSTSVEFHQRYGQGIEDYFNRLNLTGEGDAVLAALGELGARQLVRDLLTHLGYPGSAPDPDAANRLFVGRQHPLRGPLVDDRPLSETDAVRVWTDDDRNYLDWLAFNMGSAFDVVRVESGFTANRPPTAVLYLLLRHAVLNAYAEAALRLAAAAHAMSEADVVQARREAPFVHVSMRTQLTESRYGRLYEPDPDVTGDPNALVADFITSIIGQQPATQDLAEQMDAIASLVTVPTARLERALAEHLDCCAYRLDAWRLGLANEKLFALRYPATGAPVTGLHVGAFGWLEEVRPRATQPTPVTLSGELAEVFTPPGAAPLVHDPANQGYIHAPSLTQATTAALLRTGYLADASPDNPGTLAVNLSSERVRTALAFLDGIRAGQPLGALLGYRLERGMHDRHAIAETDKFITALRQAFPLVAEKLPESAPPTGTAIESLEARNVVDGLALVRHVTRTGPATYPFGLTGMPNASNEQAAVVEAEVQALVEIHDALADLAVSEGVHQAVLGNPDRAGASMDAFTKTGFPPEPEVVRTPRTGQRLNHRLGLQLRGGLPPGTSPVPGLAMTPRANADPAVNRWLADLLPQPRDVVCKVTWTDPVTGAARNRVVTQTELGLQPIDLLWALRPTDQAAMTDLDDRIIGRVQHAENLRGDTELVIRYTDQIAGKVTLFELSSLVDSLRTLLLAARPARPSDFTLPAGGGALDPRADDAVDLPRNRPQAVRDALNALRPPIDDFAGDLDTLLADPVANRAQLLDGVDTFLTRYGDLLVTASGLGLVRSGWGELVLWRRARFGEVLLAVKGAADRMTGSLAAADAKISEYDALPAATPSEERFALLQQAERLLTTAPTSPRPGTPQQLRTIVGTRRTAFANRLAALTAIARTTRATLSGLLSDVSALLPLTQFDPVGLDLTPTGDAVVTFCAGLLARAQDLRAELTQRLSATNTALADYDQAAGGPGRVTAATAAIRAALGPDALATSRFSLTQDLGQAWRQVLTASLDGELTQHLRRDFPVDDWQHGLARVRPSIALVERVSLLADALGRNEPELVPVQFPYQPGDPWLGLELPAVGWSHLSPGSVPGSEADFSCAVAQVPARLAVVGDFDGDGRGEVAAAQDAPGTQGNDFWVMDYNPGSESWSHLGPVPGGHGEQPDFDCSPAQVRARYAVAGDFDGDGRDEVAAALDAPGSQGNDFWVMDYDPASGRWAHLNPASGLGANADLSCGVPQVRARFAVVGDFDGDGLAELAVAQEAPGTQGNDFWVMDYNPGSGGWSHLGRVPGGHGEQPDFDCGAAQIAARFAVAGDFDGDGRDEVAAALGAPGTQGNDFWVMDYDPASGSWSHLNPNSGLGNRADFSCGAAQIAARFAVVGDFDGDGRDEIAVALDRPGTEGNDFWVMDYDPASGSWSHLSPGSGLGAGADFSAAVAQVPARFAVVGDFDGDGRDEVAIAQGQPGTQGNDFWVMDFDLAARRWWHLGPAAAGQGELDFDCSPAQIAARYAVVGDFDGNGRDEVAVAQDVASTEGNDFWVMDYDPSPRRLDGDRLLYTAHYSAPFDPADEQCALLVDEWTETIPATTVGTGIAAHYDRPGSTPPQTMLLVAPPARTGTWKWDDLVAAVGETLDLAPTRAVEPSQIDGTSYAQLLPATVLAAASRPITISTDLSVNNDTPLAGGPFRPARG
jgi:hypothetical protein